LTPIVLLRRILAGEIRPEDPRVLRSPVSEVRATAESRLSTKGEITLLIGQAEALPGSVRAHRHEPRRCD